MTFFAPWPIPLVTCVTEAETVSVDLSAIVIGHRTEGEKPSVGVFLRDPNPHLREFWRKPEEINRQA